MNILSLTLIFTLTASNVTFAKPQVYSSTQEGVEKLTVSIENRKLISWEDDREMVFEEYDEYNNLVDRVSVDKKTNKAISYSEVGTEILDIPLYNHAINKNSTANKKAVSTKRVDTVEAYNTITSTAKSMEVYESSEGFDTDFVLPSTIKTLAKLATQIAIGLAVSSAIATNFVATLVSAGICWVSDKIYETTGEKVRAVRYELDYYGKDKKTSKKSKTLDGGRMYQVTSGKKINKKYYEGLTYAKSGNKIANLLANNLYGVDFKVY